MHGVQVGVEGALEGAIARAPSVHATFSASSFVTRFFVGTDGWHRTGTKVVEPLRELTTPFMTNRVNNAEDEA